MATSSLLATSSRWRRSRYIFCTFCVFFLCVFLLSRGFLESNLNPYIDLIARREPNEVLDKYYNSNHSASSDLDEPFGRTGAGSSGSSFEARSREESKEERVVPAFSKSDLDDEKKLKSETTPKPSVPISSKPIIDVKHEEKSAGEKASPAIHNTAAMDAAVLENLRNCNFYRGKWVKDESHPLYAPGSCPYVDEAFDCQSNGRPDSGYLKWRWKPDGCDLPRFNATDFLVRLSGRRLMLVGDSMNRNQFESLLCLLREGLPDKSRMREIHGYKITKGRGYYVFKFEDYNCTVEFTRSHFLVREGIRLNARGNSNPTLSIDRIDKTARRWMRSDVLVFNTGHWWTHGKTSRGKNYYKEGDYVYPRFDAVEAYRRAIRTWANWIKNNINSDKLVFYRGYSSAHFRGGDWDSGGTCNGEEEPVVQGAILNSYPEKMTIVEQVIEETGIPVVRAEEGLHKKAGLQPLVPSWSA